MFCFLMQRYGKGTNAMFVKGIFYVIKKKKGATILKLLVWLFFLIFGVLFHNDCGYNIIKKRF